MNNEENNLSASKYVLLLNILENKKNKSFFDSLDVLLMKKRFDNVYELSVAENIICANTSDLTERGINKIIDDFIFAANDKTIFEKRHIYELVKISNLPAKKLKKSISKTKCNTLHRYLYFVSRETKYISFDFMILKVIDNFLLKCHLDDETKRLYKSLRNNMYDKFLTYNYTPEKKEKETTFLCWIDRILTATYNKEIKPTVFVAICRKIFILTTQTVYTYRKILNSVIFLLHQQDFSRNEYLSKFKIDLEKNIEKKYDSFEITPEELQNIMLNTLAKTQSDKEDFYYLLDSMRIVANQSIKNKLFCFNLCSYLIYYNKKYNIFSHRFIRKYFLDTFKNLIMHDDPYELKEKELQLLLEIMHIDVFFCFNRIDIFNAIIQLLHTMNNRNEKITQNNLYKYCDILDFMIFTNPDLFYPDLINYLCENNDNKQKILKKFNLSKH